MKITVLIPVYKTNLSTEETLSLKQCFKILSRYDIRLVCPTTLDTTAYNNAIGKDIKAERFEPIFFDGIKGYNNLMTNRKFYKRFESFEYMLIYQLDAWVFTDKLTEWCEKGYDYIGAPWFELHKTHEEGYGFWCCGNGGLSLRRVQAFLRVTNPNTKLLPYREIFKTYFLSFRTWKKGLKVLFRENNLRWFKKKHSYLWEDTYFCYGLDETSLRLKRPAPEEAAQFSFECSPAYLYSFIGNRLPFGCHAWKKYQYEEFWSKFIPTTK